MSFHKRYISNEQVIRLYNDGGVNRIIQWYTRGADAVITETGIASAISTILDDFEWPLLDPLKLEDTIIDLIHKELNIEDLKK
jgi:hypothetical protein